MGKPQQAFKIMPDNLKSGTPRMSLKRLPSAMECSNCPGLRHIFIFIVTKNHNKTAILIATKHEKTNMAVI